MAEAEDEIFKLKSKHSKSFSALTLAQRQELFESGRPCPPLKNLTLDVQEKGKHGDHKSYVRHFTTSNYETYKWLCGSEHLCKLYCWPCLLFSDLKSTWTCEGYSNLSGLSRAAKKHESSQNHLQCFLTLCTYGKSTNKERINKTLAVNNELHNLKVRKNQEILKRLIDVTCFLTRQELPFYGHDQSETSVNKGNYVESLHFLASYDPVLAEHLDTSTLFTSNDFQNDIINALAEVTRNHIQKEIDDSYYVGIILDETSDINTRSELSTVLRYVTNNECEIKERFVGYSNVSGNRTATGLFLHVKEVVKKYNIKEKLVALTYDGAAVKSCYQSGLQKKVLDVFPMAHFTHCYAHVLNLVLAQGMQDIPECKMFFSTLQGIATFSFHSSKRKYAVQEHLKVAIPNFAPTQWCFTSRLVDTVYTYCNEIKSFFSSISTIEDGDVTGLDKCLAKGYELFLEEFETIFLLNLFAPIFQHTDILFKALQTKDYDILKCLNIVRELLEVLQNKRKEIIAQCSGEDCKNSAFDELWQKVVKLEIKGIQEEPRKTRTQANNVLSSLQKYRTLYYNILDNVINQVKSRFSSLEDMWFFEVFHTSKYSHFTSDKEKAELQTIISDIDHLYPNLINTQILKSELSVIHTSSLFKDIPPKNIMQFLMTHDLHHGFKESFKLAKLISTIPATAPSEERCFPALKHIHTYKRSTPSETCFSDLALLSIEKELLHEISKKKNFHDSIIDVFTLKTQRVEFQYK